jgi:predicted HAD superfamily Cof-like phosphohydrolase
MQKSQQQVKEFHEKFDLVINEIPTVPDEVTLKLRCKLLLEEVKEFCEAAGFAIVGIGFENIEIEPISYKSVPNLIMMADALADIQYVNDGAAVSLGIDLEPLANEVHRSNMSKLWTVDEISHLRSDVTKDWTAKGDTTNGFVVKNESQKVIKSPSYSPADIKSELIKQGAKL